MRRDEKEGVRSKLRNYFQRRIRLVTFGLVGVAILISMAGQFWLAELFNHYRLYYLLFAFALGMVHLVQRNYRLSLVCVAMAIYFFLPLRAYFLSDQEIDAEGTQIKVMHANVLISTTEWDPFKKMVAEEDPDVLLIMEVTPLGTGVLSELKTIYPHEVNHARGHPFGFWLLSKFPIKSHEILQLDPDMPSILAILDVAGQELTFVGTHPLAPMMPSWRDVNQAVLGLCRDALASRSGPKVLMGDLNCTPFAPRVQEFLRDSGLRDSGEGRGLWSTWYAGAGVLQLPIDHCFVSKEIAVRNRKIGRSFGSDHRPVVVELQLPK